MTAPEPPIDDPEPHPEICDWCGHDRTYHAALDAAEPCQVADCECDDFIAGEPCGYCGTRPCQCDRLCDPARDLEDM